MNSKLVIVTISGNIDLISYEGSRNMISWELFKNGNLFTSILYFFENYNENTDEILYYEAAKV